MQLHVHCGCNCGRTVIRDTFKSFIVIMNNIKYYFFHETPRQSIRRQA